MQSVGSKLRAAREQKGYSLDDINARTRINSKNLAAIEGDKVQMLSSPFFYRSFVRQYAETVGLDFRILSPAVEVLAGNMRQPDLPGQGEHQIVRVAPLQARPKRDWSWVMPTVVLLGVVAIGSGGYAYLKYSTPQTLKAAVMNWFSFPSASPKVPSKVASKALLAAAVKPPQLAPVPQSNPTVAAVSQNPLPAVKLAPPPSLPDKIHLELAATERTWLSVSADGKTAYTGILEPDETKVLEGQDSARLRTGNAGGVSIVFNGKSLGTIGPRGTTRTVIFSKTGYEIEPGATLTSSTHIGGWINLIASLIPR